MSPIGISAVVSSSLDSFSMALAMTYSSPTSFSPPSSLVFFSIS